MEYLDRGLVAVKVSGGVYLSWRYLGTDDPSTGFNLYRNGVKINASLITTSTNYTDTQGTNSSAYTVKTVLNGVEQDESENVPVWAQQYKTLNLRRPAGGSNSSGSYAYTPNDCSAGDVDGDGKYEIIVKWDPSNAKDNSQEGYTGNVYLDCYKMDGTFLWRIDLGKNIRAGAHYTQFMVYDLDGDGKAELVCKTAPGTVDGKGKNVLMGSDSPAADYRNSSGYVLSGPEYLTVFEGLTGGEIHTVAYNPPRGTVSAWGDNYGNRVDRFLACIAYLDGVHPSVVMCRGYYTRSTLVAYDFKDGKLAERWYHNSDRSGQGAFGEGYHNISVADADGDGYDEIIYGSACIDHDGKLLYRKGFGHGDAMHVSDMDPGRSGLEGWFIHEDKASAYGFELRDLKTGQVIFGEKTGTDVGRGLAADIDAKHPGFEMWSAGSSNVYNCKAQAISTNKPSVNFRIYWDGDLQDELLDGTKLDKWNGNGTSRLFTAYNYSNAKEVNGTKANPCLSADILGDWREEMIFFDSADPSKLLIFTTVLPTTHRLFTLMHDPVYRMGVAWQNVAYNQSPHLGFYIGDGLENVSQPDIYVVNANAEPQTTLTKQGDGSSTQTVELGSAISSFSYVWTNAASVVAEGLPNGVDAIINNTAKTVTISGTPTETGAFAFTVTTTGGAGDPVVQEGIITVNFIPEGIKRIAYITDPSAGNYANDTRILPALKTCSDFYVTEIDARQRNIDFSMYDLLIISEIPLSSSPLIRELATVNKPVLNMKLHAYKVSDGTWGWANNGYGDNTTATNIVVNTDMLNHPIFKDVTFINGNEIQMLSSVKEKGMTYMNPESFVGVSGGNISTIAAIKDAQQVSILEIEEGTTINGTTLSDHFIQIGLNSSSYAHITDDGVRIVLNASYYLLGVESNPVNIKEPGSSEPLIQILFTEEKISVTIRSSASAPVNLKLVDVKGYSYVNQDFFHSAGKEKYELNRKELPPGIYVLTVKTTDLYHVEKILLK
jgi:hypothetical protein